MPKLSHAPSSRAFESVVAPRAAVLYARAGANRTPAAAQASLVEMERLVRGLGMRVADTVVHRGAAGARLIGTGKLKELADALAALQAQTGSPPLFVVDEPVRPGQLRKLEAALGAEVSDRTDIILRVFERRANTGMAHLEVEMARLSYDAPRVRDLAAINDRTGGGGRGERGHTGVELRKQRIRAQLNTLDREIRGQRRLHDDELQRRSEAPSVALVGYTNAGKSSLMRALTGSKVFIEDQLFATLSTTVRALEPATAPRILVTDTVGFIENLPHELVASFRSTLAEAAAADLLLFVVDAADDAWQAQLRVAEETVAAIGADLPALILCNKIDRVSAERRAAITAARPEALLMSAHTPADVQRLRAAIVAFFDDRMLDGVLRVPLPEARLIGEIHTSAKVTAQEHDEAGTWLRVRTMPAILARLRHRLGAAAPAIATPGDLLERARRHGLALTSTAPDFERTGLDFLVAHAADEQGVPYVLRTPRRPEVSTAALVEARVLRLVAPRLPVAVPRWQIHAPDLIAYPRLPGTPAVTVSPAGAPTFNIIDAQAPSDTFLDSFAAMLSALQAIPATLVRNAGVPRRSMAEVRQREAEAMARIKDLLAPPEALWERWQRWLANDQLWPGDEQRVLVHGDLHPGHLLLDDSGRLTGVLDWTEAAFTDPSIDLALFCGCFGAGALLGLLPRFERAGGRTFPRLAEHAAERWAAFPAQVADWAVRTNNPGALEHARELMAGTVGTSA